MSSTPLDLSQCKASFEVEPHESEPAVLKNITVTVTHPSYHPTTTRFKYLNDEPEENFVREPTPLATLTAIHIKPYAANGQFLEIMDEESDELHQFSVALYDKYGKIKPSLFDGSKGSGCWGKELNNQDIMYVLDIHVDPDMRERGVGSWVLKALVESSYVRQSDFVMSWPTPTGGVESQESWEELKAKQIKFFRKNGFRRIAQTNFFGVSPSPTHPSRQISASDDFDPPTFRTVPRLSSEEREAQFPVHILAASLKTPDINDMLRTFYTSDPNIISKSDENGYTPIWIAAAAGNVHAARSLISLFSLTHQPPDSVHPDLTNCTNDVYLTPLEKVSERMRSGREFSETLLQTWDGYSEDDLMLEVLLKRAMGLGVAEATDEEYVRRRKWGCTCGQCDDGWMSKRMRFRLQRAVADQIGNMDYSPIQWVARQPCSADDIEMEYHLSFIPPHLHSQIFQTFYKGFEAVFRAILETLTTPGVFPLPAIVFRSHALDNRAATFYFDKSGKIEYALDCVTHCAKEQSLTYGDGTFEDAWENDDDMGTDYKSLPKCANDEEFDLVRKMLGLDPGLGWGPYMTDEDIGMGSDSNEDGEHVDAEYIRSVLEMLAARRSSGTAAADPTART